MFVASHGYLDWVLVERYFKRGRIVSCELTGILRGLSRSARFLLRNGAGGGGGAANNWNLRPSVV